MRYAISCLTDRKWGLVFPVGTLFVNVLGCFLMSLIVQAAVRGADLSETQRVALTTGFLGGLTTYSAFNTDLLRLWEEKLWGTALANFALTNVLCLVAGACGLFVARRMWTAG